MITNEYSIHTFSLKLQCKYSEIQNIIEQNECIRTSEGKLGLSPYYQIPQFKDIGVEIQLGQSVTHPCWLILIINPSSLFAGTYEPTALFQADKKSVQQIKHRLRNILDKIGVDRRLKEFKLSRCDLTCNLYYERKADVQDRLDIFKKSFPIFDRTGQNMIQLIEFIGIDRSIRDARKVPSRCGKVCNKNAIAVRVCVIMRTGVQIFLTVFHIRRKPGAVYRLNFIAVVCRMNTRSIAYNSAMVTSLLGEYVVALEPFTKPRLSADLTEL